MYKPNQDKSNTEFLGSPVVRILHFYWGVNRFDPWMEKLRSQVLHDVAPPPKIFFNLEKN